MYKLYDRIENERKVKFYFSFNCTRCEKKRKIYMQNDIHIGLKKIF